MSDYHWFVLAFQYGRTDMSAEEVDFQEVRLLFPGGLGTAGESSRRLVCFTNEF